MGGLHFMYATAAVTLILVAIGVFGACKEKKWALIIFVVGMILSSLFLFGISIQSFALMSEIGAELQAQYQHLLPLSNASTVVVDDLNEIQKEFQCCGLDAGYQDWGGNIPDSCVCDDDSVQKCVEPPAGSQFTGRAEGELIRIYADPCVPFLISHVKDVIKTTVNIIMGIILLLVLSSLLGIIALCQLNRKVDVPAVVYSQEAKAGNYTTLTDVTEETVDL
ncbi:tetraspanin-8-like isoform X2 [Gouania willdenowi]|nr:tetraspanin-8-like isoform X2 [Gouania willdenowi]